MAATTGMALAREVLATQASNIGSTIGSRLRAKRRQTRPTAKKAAATAVDLSHKLQIYSQATLRCRQYKDFFFLDLPGKVRSDIYKALFADHAIPVCSFNKSHLDEFARDERCQILMTCKTIAKEAASYLYYFTKWRINSTSALSYLTWHDVHPTKLANITSLTLTHLELVGELYQRLGKFRSLQRLVIDVPHEFKLRVPGKRNRDDQQRLVRLIMGRKEYLGDIHPFIFHKRNWTVMLIVHINYSLDYPEVSTLTPF
jgi:hypothetical protein